MVSWHCVSNDVAGAGGGRRTDLALSRMLQPLLSSQFVVVFKQQALQTTFVWKSLPPSLETLDSPVSHL